MERPVKRKLPFIFLIWLAVGWNAFAACTLGPNQEVVANLPAFGFTAMAGQVLTPSVTQTGCPSFSITNVAVSGGVLSATGSGFTFSTNDWMVITTQNSFPFQQLSNTVMQIATATPTTFTTKPITSLLPFSSSAVTMTAIQLSLVNYSIATTAGTITGTLSCTTNCPSAVTLTVGSTPTNGNCSYVGAGPVFTGVTSTQKLTITATAVVGGSTTTIPIPVCSNTVLPQIAGDLYYQNYVGQNRHLQSFVWGTTNQQVTWSKTGPCTLSNTTGSRDVVVAMTGTGYCNVTVTSVADVTKSQTAQIYIPAALPSYGDNTPVLTESLPCAVDPNQTGNLFTVGSGKAYASIGAVPWNNAALMIPGSTVQIFNTASGTSQTSYAEGWQIEFGGTSGQPVHVCGVPNAAGYPPIIEAAGAVFPSWTSTFAAGFGLINIQSFGCHGVYPTAPCVAYLLISGLQLQDVIGPNTWSITGGGSGTWGPGADTINDRQGSFITMDSIYSFNSEQGTATYGNANNDWAGLSQMVDISRPVCMSCGGVAGDTSSHPAYLQTFGMFYHEFLIGDAPSGDAGSCIKSRSVGDVIVGGYCGKGYARYVDLVEDQDSYMFVDVSFYAQAGLPSAGDAWGVNGVTQFIDQRNHDVIAYNIFNNSGVTGSGSPFHYLADHDNNSCTATPPICPAGYSLNSRYGHLWFFDNTYWGGGELFDQHNVFGTDIYFLAGTIHSYNNILWPSPATVGGTAYNSSAITNFDIKNDLWLTGNINNTGPIIGDHFNFFSSDLLYGWVGDSDPNNYWYERPMDSHITGLSSLIFTGTQPFSTGSFALPGGSAAIGVATTLTGEAALFPPRFNAISTSGVLTARTTAFDLGAISSGFIPPPPSTVTRIRSGASRRSGSTR